MVFSSFVFLCAFLPPVLVLHQLIRPVRWKNLLLLLSSLLFYAWGEPVYILLMLGSIVINYGIGLGMAKASPAGKKAWLALALALNLGSILFFKYGDFLLGNLGLLLHADMPVIGLSLPIGISFYTFQILSYVADVYRGRVKAQRSLLSLGTYIALFPQLVAGPIVRYETVETELRERHADRQDILDGLYRLAFGLGKKVIFANAMGLIADAVFDGAVAGTAVTWFGALAYTLQIYFDFSGYSDMAIGMGRMLGFHFDENFNYPYIAADITGFWRRWHISLSGWFRDYVYIPLGGSRCSVPRHILNLAAVWALTGLWHGASWNYLLWGVYYGILLICEKYVTGSRLKKLPAALRHLLTLLLIVIGWTVFRVEDTARLVPFLGSMFSFSGEALGAWLTEHTGLLYSCCLMLPAAAACMPVGRAVRARVSRLRYGRILTAAAAAAVFYVSLALLLGSTYNPFIYFRF